MPSEMRLVIQQAKYHGQVASQDVCLGTGQRLATYHADLHTSLRRATHKDSTAGCSILPRRPRRPLNFSESSGFFATTSTAQPGYLTLTSFNHLQPSAIIFNLAMPCMMLLTSLNFARLLSASRRDNGLSSGSHPLCKLIQQTHDQQLETETSNQRMSMHF